MTDVELLENIGKNLLIHQTTTSSVSLDDIQKLYSLGYHHYVAGRYDSAATTLEKVVALSPFYADGIYALALTYYQQKKFTAALRCLEVCNILDPHNPSIHLYSSYCLIELKEFTLAKEFLKTSIRLMKEDLPQKTEAKLILQRLEIDDR